MVFLDIIGQIFAIWPNINSRCATFCCAVRLINPGVSSLSSRRSLRGEELVFSPCRLVYQKWSEISIEMIGYTGDSDVSTRKKL